MKETQKKKKKKKRQRTNPMNTICNNYLYVAHSAGGESPTLVFWMKASTAVFQYLMIRMPK